MRVFLTGSTGFIGGHIKTFLERNGHEVYCFKRGDALLPELFLEEYWTPDYVIHCAAETKQDHLMFNSNVVLTQRLLDFARDVNAGHFIHIGSSSEYGHTNEPRREEMRCVPTTLYEATKLAATNLVLGYGLHYGMDVCVIRPSTIYGAGMKGNLLPLLVQSTLKEIEVWDGAHDWSYIDDFLAGLKVVMEGGAWGQIVNVSSGQSVPNSIVALMFREALKTRGLKSLIHFVDKRNAHDVDTWIVDNTKLRGLGWQPTFSLARGLNEYIDVEIPF